MTAEAAFLGAVERIARAADAPAVAPAEERAKADAILDGLAAERLLSPLLPAGDGGARGLGFAAAARAVARVARVSGSAGLIWAMHLAQAATLARHGRGDHLRGFTARLAEGRILVASGTSEAGVGGDILRSICRTAPDGPGSHRLEKRLANVSYLDRAGAVLATAMHEERGRAAQRLVLIEAADLDVRVERETLFLGMRGVVNRAVTIKGRFPDAAVFPEPFAVVARTMSAASHVLWAAVWSGLAAAALRKAEALAAPPPAPPAGRAPGVEADVGGPRAMRLAAAGGRLYAMNALIRDACLALDGAADAPGSPLGGAVRSNSLKIHCADMLAEVVADCALAAGLGGYVEGTPESLSEVVRDSFSARIMVSSDRLAGNNAAVRRFVRDEI